VIICVFGFYGKGNTGDDRLQFSLVQTLSDEHTVIFLPHMIAPPTDLLSRCDLIIIGGGGLVFERVGIWRNVRNWIGATSAPIIVLGIGINRVDEQLKLELNTLFKRAILVMVRDNESALLTGPNPIVSIGPDLSWFHPYSEQTCQTQGNHGIALNLVHCHWKDYEPEGWVRSLQHEKLLPFPFKCIGKDSDFTLLESLLPLEIIPKEFTLRPLEICECAVVCRYHAVQFALQLRVPFIAISYDFKVARLMHEAGLADCLLDTNEHSLLTDKLRYLRDNRASILKRVSEYSTIQREAGREWKNRVLNLVQEIKATPKRHPILLRLRSTMFSLLAGR